MNYLINAIRGFCMAIADSVPGVSGGTIAFILGFYDKFISSLDALAYGKKSQKKEALKFLIQLGTGWGLCMILAIIVLTNLFENHIYKISSVFIGLIVFAIPIIIKEEKESLKGKYKNIIFTIMGIILVSLITYFNPISNNPTGIDISNLNIFLCIYIFIASMIAVSAMLLPGISGSTLLLIFGLYMPIITSAREVLRLDFSSLPVLIIAFLGVITGVALIIKLIKKALDNYRSKTIYFIIGLMLGSIYAIIMGPTTLSTSKDPLSISTFSIIFFIIGGLIIFGLEKLKVMIESKTKK